MIGYPLPHAPVGARYTQRLQTKARILGYLRATATPQHVQAIARAVGVAETTIYWHCRHHPGVVQTAPGTFVVQEEMR